ncbi:hypothetical protein P171DRAFT_517362 [Karstenula rhodostoma CBS 690.94]|uniref:FAD-binding domain-containing protein n=1 Tax=Karstenula rhodostoma CBS 690.94 TaxID=1392251 RepID=A0A9P4PVT1_9PLEO|nr:hypothetical protein P171DRAFT_517362 [Karstenula rhodostoma CBS 690.94]
MKIPPREPLRLTTWKTVYDMFLACLLEDSENPRAKYRTGYLVQNVSEEREKICVTYYNGNDATQGVVEADIVIAADGAHSTIRNKIDPGMSPKYAGYVSWRGRVPESALSASTLKALRNRCVIHRVDGGYQISYYVPAGTNSARAGERDFVFIWYDTLPEGSPEFEQTMTDVDGKIHNTTVPRGKIIPEVWRHLLDRNSTAGNPTFIELVGKIREPFVSAIRDFQGSKAVFLHGKLLL